MSENDERPTLDTIGKRMRWLRQHAQEGKKGINLAAAIGVSPATLSNWENDKDVPPAGRLRRLAEHFGCSLAYLQKGDTLPSDGSALTAQTIGHNFVLRMSVAIDSTNVTPRLLSHPQLQFIIEPCSVTLLDLEELDKGSDMIQALPTLDVIIQWAELAWNERLPGAGMLLFNACDRAVHFKCFVTLAARLIEDVTPYFGKMDRVACLEKGLHQKMCARWGDVHKICAAENPLLGILALEYFEKAWAGDGRGEARSLDYPAFRSPSIVAGSLPMSDADFEKHLARLEEGLQGGRFMRRTEVHLVEGRAETNAQRYKLRQLPKLKKKALDDMQEAQRLSREVGKQHGPHNEMWLRTERLIITLWNLGIRDHISEPGMGPEAAVAKKADEIHRHAEALGSDRLAAAMLKQIRRLRQ